MRLVLKRSKIRLKVDNRGVGETQEDQVVGAVLIQPPPAYQEKRYNREKKTRPIMYRSLRWPTNRSSGKKMSEYRVPV